MAYPKASTLQLTEWAGKVNSPFQVVPGVGIEQEAEVHQTLQRSPHYLPISNFFTQTSDQVPLPKSC